MEQDLEIKRIKKINGEYFSVNKISLKDIMRKKEMCVGEMGMLQLKLDDLNFRMSKVKEELSIIDDLLCRKNDLINSGEEGNEDKN